MVYPNRTLSSTYFSRENYDLSNLGVPHFSDPVKMVTNFWSPIGSASQWDRMNIYDQSMRIWFIMFHHSFNQRCVHTKTDVCDYMCAIYIVYHVFSSSLIYKWWLTSRSRGIIAINWPTCVDGKHVKKCKIMRWGQIYPEFNHHLNLKTWELFTIKHHQDPYSQHDSPTCCVS